MTAYLKQRTKTKSLPCAGTGDAATESLEGAERGTSPLTKVREAMAMRETRSERAEQWQVHQSSEIPNTPAQPCHADYPT